MLFILFGETLLDITSEILRGRSAFGIKLYSEFLKLLMRNIISALINNDWEVSHLFLFDFLEDRKCIFAADHIIADDTYNIKALH